MKTPLECTFVTGLLPQENYYFFPLEKVPKQDVMKAPYLPN
jgi:hypothetical protein